MAFLIRHLRGDSTACSAESKVSRGAKVGSGWPGVALFVVAIFAVLAASASGVHSKRLLTRQFEPRLVSQIEIGDFHFRPGQLAPLHTHAAPSFGYVSKGSIYYQVEGQEPQILKAGDAFYEPAGPKILHFDNASKTEETVFTDINFERAGEPFIVLAAPLTEKIDRRSFPSETLDGVIANTMEISEELLDPAEHLDLDAHPGTVVYVAQGSVSVQTPVQAPIVYLAGQTLYAPKATGGARVFNASQGNPATLIVFRLSKMSRSWN